MTDNNDAPTMAAEGNSDQNQAAGSEPKFAVKQLYLKDASFESPMGIRGVARLREAKAHQDLNTKITRLDEKHVEVVLKFTITVKLPDDQIVYLVEVHQAGLFLASDIDGQNFQHLVASVCPQIIFPYLREAVDNLVTRAGFPALVLPPINFDAVYAQVRAQEAQKAHEQSQQEKVSEH